MGPVTMKVEHTFENKPKRQEDEGVSNASGNTYGIKFDGEILSIHLSRYGRVYHVWPKFQCKKMSTNSLQWARLTYGKIHLNSGLVDFFDGLDELLPRFDKEIMLKYFSPIALSEKDEDGYYLWNPDDNRLLTSWYRDNKQGIKEACNGFINTIPSEVRNEAAAFTCGYIAGNQWFLIKQSQLYPSFIELMRANPALAYTFAHRKVLGLKTKRLGKKDTERLLAGKHRKIAAYLGLGDSNAIVHILKKIPASACIRHRMQGLLKKLSRKELWKTLMHLETIDEPVLDLYGSLGNYPRYFVPSKNFIEDVAAHFPTNGSRFGRHDEIWNDCLRPLFNVFYYLEDERHEFNSMTELRNKYERVIEILRRDDLPAREHKYPTPPIPGSNMIEPVVNRRELYEEGFDQRNCIYSYDADILAGKRYVYRVLEPERATLSLRKVRGGWGKRRAEWVIEEIKTRANAQPSPETIVAAREWFGSAASSS